jgi:phosphatidate phosphatase PAH1
MLKALLSSCVLLALACGGDTSTWMPAETAGLDCPLPSAEDQSWVHSTRVLTTVQGDAHHGSADVLINPGDTADVVARFSYGPVFKDLEDENISAWIESAPCDWQSLGVARTDESGSARFSVPADIASSPGHHNVRFEVNGDGSDAYSSVWVAEVGQPVVVFDIDGTLTTGDSEHAKSILYGHQHEMYAAANEVAWAWADRGYQVIYISGRPVYQDRLSRKWLDDRGFPRGPLKLTHRIREGLPLSSLVGAFKRQAVEEMRVSQGLAFGAAYGNASTDICAYAAAGIPASDTYIIGDKAGEACEEEDGGSPTRAIESYARHLEELQAIWGNR